MTLPMRRRRIRAEWIPTFGGMTVLGGIPTFGGMTGMTVFPVAGGMTAPHT
jgi:hypothetical protein